MARRHRDHRTRHAAEGERGGARSAVRGGFRRWTSRIQQVLTEAKETGELDAALDVEAAALFILSAWEGTLIAARADKSSAPLDAFFRMVFDVVLR
ncbi:TetR family transcriptional regulator C-terminal domain-containing protein [Kitasatospora sp. NPDC001175]|uniref:TetR family transcriptional regulator C-terminal domain-containing protein n=1 Tax=Kitasatospora sp. NPDC001175 TaxID=3157103 RepID=UPI003CFE8FBE